MKKRKSQQDIIDENERLHEQINALLQQLQTANAEKEELSDKYSQLEDECKKLERARDYYKAWWGYITAEVDKLAEAAGGADKFIMDTGSNGDWYLFVIDQVRKYHLKKTNKRVLDLLKYS